MPFRPTRALKLDMGIDDDTDVRVIIHTNTSFRCVRVLIQLVSAIKLINTCTKCECCSVCLPDSLRLAGQKDTWMTMHAGTDCAFVLLRDLQAE